MSLTWSTVDKWRQQRGMPKADLARAAGIPESSVYRGLKKDSKLQPSMRSVIRGVFPERFDHTGALLDDSEVTQ